VNGKHQWCAYFKKIEDGVREIAGCRTMILAVDVYYGSANSIVAGVAFEDWTSREPSNIYISRIQNVSDYQPGQFFRRELPCIIRLIEEHSISPETIVIDGYVFLDGRTRPGLGKRLYDALQGRTKVIGVAKNSFSGISSDFEIYRGKSAKPLYITCVGVELETAKRQIASMYGNHRIPVLLKKADQACRQSC
jgi:deoxyribonuclease V